MGKLATFVVLMGGLTLLFYITGLIGSNPLFDLLFNPQDMTTLNFYTVLAGAIATAGAAVVVGIVTKNIELAAATTFVPVVMVLLWNFISVFNKISSVNKVFAVLIIAPSLMMFWITMFEWWRGRTT